MSIDVSKVKGFKAPLPAKGKVIVEILSVKTCKGSTKDKNDELSQGFVARYKIVGPETAIMDNGESALGYVFDERLWLPRRSWEEKDPQGASRATAKLSKRLSAWYGDDDAIPDNLDDSELKVLEESRLQATISTKWDDFADDTIVVIQELGPIPAEEATF